MEMIHSSSYTHIIKNLYSDPDEIFGTITSVMKKFSPVLRTVTASYDSFITRSSADSASETGNTLWKELDQFQDESGTNSSAKLFRAMMNVNILEGIRFYVSHLLVALLLVSLKLWKDLQRSSH